MGDSLTPEDPAPALTPGPPRLHCAATAGGGPAAAEELIIAHFLSTLAEIAVTVAARGCVGESR